MERESSTNKLRLKSRNGKINTFYEFEEELEETENSKMILVKKTSLNSENWNRLTTESDKRNVKLELKENSGSIKDGQKWNIQKHRIGKIQKWYQDFYTIRNEKNHYFLTAKHDTFELSLEYEIPGN